MNSGRGCRIPRVPCKFAGSEECSEPDADGCTDVKTIEIIWDEWEELEENVFGKRQSKPTFSFPIKSPCTFDDKIDAWIVEDTGMEAVVCVVGAQYGGVAFERCGPY